LSLFTFNLSPGFILQLPSLTLKASSNITPLVFLLQLLKILMNIRSCILFFTYLWSLLMFPLNLWTFYILHILKFVVTIYRNSVLWWFEND
jgi:hypothetical protein